MFHYYFMFWKVLGGLGLVLFAWMVLGSTILRVSTITVLGQGKLSVPPTEVSLIATKVNVGTEVTAAIDEGDKQIKVLEDIARKTSGDVSMEIQKSFYRVTPQQGQYIVANAFSVKTSQVSRINDVIKALYQAGATTVSDVSFSVSDKENINQQARVKAVEDASAQAKRIAKAAGKTLGRVISIQDDNTTPNSSVTTGTNLDITKQVSVVYEIW
jgi:uncharacterized protein YggE